jgi:ubiquinone biosynthesis protein
MRAERILLGPVLTPTVRATLHAYPSVASRQVLNETWDEYEELAPSIPKQKNFGAALIVRSAALTIAFYKALIARGFEPAAAQTLVGAATWKIYQVMGRVPWLAARVMTGDQHRRLLLAARMFRRFPFGSPSYIWNDVDGGRGGVGFDCLRCPAAEYFKSHDEAALCVATFCELDFPLATQWGAELIRSGSIAARQ